MKTLLTLGMAFLFSFSTVTARAEITQWDYSVEGVFTSWTDNKRRTGTGENNSSAIKTVGKKIDLPYQYQGGGRGSRYGKRLRDLEMGRRLRL